MKKGMGGNSVDKSVRYRNGLPFPSSFPFSYLARLNE